MPQCAFASLYVYIGATYESKHVMNQKWNQLMTDVMCWLVKPKKAEKTYLSAITLFTTDQQGFRWDSTRATVLTRRFDLLHLHHTQMLKRWWKGRSDELPLLLISSCCACIFASLSLICECPNWSLWNLVCTSQHLSPSQRHTINPSHKSVCMRTTLSLPHNGSAAMLPWERIRATKELLEVSISVRSVSYQRRVCVTYHRW
jgi:hypothetical protein